MLDHDLLLKLAVRPNSTKTTLERAVSGEPFFLFSDTAWELFHRLTREEVVHYLDTRKRQGFNAVLAVALPELDASGQAFGPDGQSLCADSASENCHSQYFHPNRYGEVPLVNDDPRTPNEKYFSHIDWVVQAAAERGILVFLVPTWARWINGGWQGNLDSLLFDNDSAASFGTFLGERYPFLPKMMGGDSNPIWTDAGEIWRRFRANGRQVHDAPIPTTVDLPRFEWFDVFRSMGQAIATAEKPFWGQVGAPLLTYHPTALWLPWSPDALASSFFGDDEWLTLDACQSGHADTPNLIFDPPLHFWNARAPHAPISKMVAQSDGKRPVLDLEGHYEGMHVNLTPGSGVKWMGDDIRSGAWQSVLSGACGVVYGHNTVWQMYDAELAKTAPQIVPVLGVEASESWKEALDVPGPGYIAILASFFASLPADMNLQPAQDLLLSSAAPEASRDADGRIDVMRDVSADYSNLLVAHSGSGYAFEMDIGAAFGEHKVTAAWLDPRTGKEAPFEMCPGQTKFTPPTAGSVKHDWVLLVSRC